MHFQVSQNVSLRLLQAADAEDLFKVVDENRSHLREWLPWLDRNISPQDSAAFIESIHRQADADLGFACGVYWANSLVGMCGFHEINKREKSVVVGYWLAQDYQGKGIISQCTSFFISYAFDQLSLNKVLIPVAEKNEKSRAVCERIGLISDGKIERAEWLYDRWVDHVRYYMDSQTWQDRSGP